MTKVSDAIDSAENWFDSIIRDMGECCNLSPSELENIRTIQFALKFLEQNLAEEMAMDINTKET